MNPESMHQSLRIVPSGITAYALLCAWVWGLGPRKQRKGWEFPPNESWLYGNTSVNLVTVSIWLEGRAFLEKCFFKINFYQVIQFVTFWSPSWRSRFTFERVTFSPSQKGHQQNRQVYGNTFKNAPKQYGINNSGLEIIVICRECCFYFPQIFWE